MKVYYEKLQRLFKIIYGILQKDGLKHKRHFMDNMKDQLEYLKAKDFHEEKYSKTLIFSNSYTENKDSNSANTNNNNNSYKHTLPNDLQSQYSSSTINKKDVKIDSIQKNHEVKNIN